MFIDNHGAQPINLKFLWKTKLESESAKVGQISPEICLIACQKHFYGASKNIYFILVHRNTRQYFVFAEVTDYGRILTNLIYIVI